MANAQMTAQMSKKGGFIAALDQSGGSSPGALRLYGIPDTAYSGEAEMFRLIHQMRVRIMTARLLPATRSSARSCSKARWTARCAASRPQPICGKSGRSCRLSKSIAGLNPKKDGVQLMRPMPQLDQLCDRAVKARRLWH
jgi:fructose-bisphosphate aldolase class I